MYEHGTCTQDDFLKAVAQQEAIYCRIPVHLIGKELKIARLELVSPIPPPRWKEHTWDYQTTIFSAQKCSEVDVAGWLKKNEFLIYAVNAKATFVLDHAFTIGQYPSRYERSGYQPLEWPFVKYVSQNQTPQSIAEPTKFVPKSEHGLFFESFVSAVMCFFDIPRLSGTVNSWPPIVLRLQNQSGRIKKMKIGDTGISVDIDGDNIVGGHLRLITSNSQSAKTLTQNGFQTISLSYNEEEPLESVILIQGDDVLDRVTLNTNNTNGWSLLKEKQGQIYLLIKQWLELTNHKKARTLSVMLAERNMKPVKDEPTGDYFELALHCVFTALKMPTAWGGSILDTPGVDIFAFDYSKSLIFIVSATTGTDIDKKLITLLPVSQKTKEICSEWEVRPVIITSQPLSNCSPQNIKGAENDGVLVLGAEHLAYINKEPPEFSKFYELLLGVDNNI